MKKTSWICLAAMLASGLLVFANCYDYDQYMCLAAGYQTSHTTISCGPPTANTTCTAYYIRSSTIYQDTLVDITPAESEGGTTDFGGPTSFGHSVTYDLVRCNGITMGIAPYTYTYYDCSQTTISGHWVQTENCTGFTPGTNPCKGS